MGDDLRERLEGLSTDELITIVRERDLEQWRPEVFALAEAILSLRHVNVMAVRAAGPTEKPTLDFQALDVVATFGGPLEANLCRMALEQAGIRALLSTENLAGVHPPLGLAIGVGVLVQPEDAAAAREFLEAVGHGRIRLPEEPDA
jgi:hypothetical protein